MNDKTKEYWRSVHIWMYFAESHLEKVQEIINRAEEIGRYGLNLSRDYEDVADDIQEYTLRHIGDMFSDASTDSIGEYGCNKLNYVLLKYNYEHYLEAMAPFINHSVWNAIFQAEADAVVPTPDTSVKVIAAAITKATNAVRSITVKRH